MKRLYVALVGVIALTFGVIGTIAAQGNKPQQFEAPQALPGTTFTYQGLLRNANGAVNGNCDMAFHLFDAATNGTQIGNPITATVAVTNGLFIVSLDFGADAFNGEARWLDIRVKCAGDAAFTTLTPRQSISSAPYALALPGLRTMQNTESPNVIGGYAGNMISDTVQGGTIGGGGLLGYINRITADYATIGGGGDNAASGSSSTIGGGAFNSASGDQSTVSGGAANKASGYLSTIGGGDFNTASGGQSTIPGGFGALASHTGEMAYASGTFSTVGDAQASVYVLRATVQNNQSSRELFLDGSSGSLTVTNTRTLAFDVLIVARSDNGKSSGWRYQGVIENKGGTTAFIGTPTKTALGEDDPVWDVDLVADNANDALVIKGFSNSSGDTIRFVATVRTVEVSY